MYRARSTRLPRGLSYTTGTIMELDPERPSPLWLWELIRSTNGGPPGQVTREAGHDYEPQHCNQRFDTRKTHTLNHVKPAHDAATTLINLKIAGLPRVVPANWGTKTWGRFSKDPMSTETLT